MVRAGIAAPLEMRQACAKTMLPTTYLLHRAKMMQTNGKGGPSTSRPPPADFLYAPPSNPRVSAPPFLFTCLAQSPCLSACRQASRNFEVRHTQLKLWE